MGVQIVYHGEGPVFAASDQARDQLGHTALLALVGVGHQALHVRSQHGDEGVAEVAEQSLEEQQKFTSMF